MIGLIQRVQEAQVLVQSEVVGQIKKGLVLFLGVDQADTQVDLKKLVHKVINYRVFEDGSGKMNLSLLDCQCELLVVSQFTLVADNAKGLRPSFSSAAAPQLAMSMYEAFIKACKQHQIHVASGVFGAEMQVHLINDGPVTFYLQT
jgi:D-tyrosyl-tRNA(Tyr) deacylase